MKIFYKYGRYITGNLYMVLKMPTAQPSEKMNELIDSGIVTQECLNDAMATLEAAKSNSASGTYPVVYLCSEFNSNGGLVHYCLNTAGQLIGIAWKQLMAHIPLKLYDGSEYKNTFVKAVLNEAYDNYGSTWLMSRYSRDGIVLEQTIDSATITYDGSIIKLSYKDEIWNMDKAIPKANISTDKVRCINSLIYALYNKEKYMLIEAGDEYLLLKI